MVVRNFPLKDGPVPDTERLVLARDSSWIMFYGMLTSVERSPSIKSSFVLDTIYGCQDRKDDALAGVKSTALFFGEHVKAALAIFGAIFILMLALVGIANKHGPSYFLVSVGGSAAHIIWQLTTLDIDSPKSCGCGCFLFIRHVVLRYGPFSRQ